MPTEVFRDFSSVPPSKFRDFYLQQYTAASFQILPNAVFVILSFDAL
jgi:hypothetical protein